MATALKAPSASENLPAKGPSGLPAFLVDKVKANSGQGVSQDQADNLIPLIYVLQTNSPQVNPRHESYVEGAQPGDFWLRNSPHPIVKGQVGLMVQPCHFYKDVVEWIPRDEGGGGGSGFVGRHKVMPATAIETRDERNPNVVWYKTKDGNDLIETRNHTVYALLDGMAPMPFMLALSGTGHGVSRSWMFSMNAKAIAGGGVAPAYAHTYKLTTKIRKNAKGEWFAISVEDGDWVQTQEDFDRGEQMFKAMESGAKRAEAPVEDNVIHEKDEVSF